MRKAKIGVGQELEDRSTWDGFFVIQRENSVEIQNWNGSEIEKREEYSLTDEQLWNSCQCIFNFETEKSFNEININDLEDSGFSGYLAIQASMLGGDVSIRDYHISLMEKYEQKITDEWEFEELFPNRYKNWHYWNSVCWDFARKDARSVEQLFRKEMELSDEADIKETLKTSMYRRLKISY
jgi:hypothetical protein